MAESSSKQLPADARLSRVEHIRKRPGMYIGGTDSRALQNCVLEVLANIYQNQACKGCGQISVDLHRDGSISIEGSHGNPPRVTALKELLHQIEHECFECTTPPQSLFGMVGVGLSAVSALSEWMMVRVTHKSRSYSARFRQGNLSRPFMCGGRAAKHNRGIRQVRFMPDPQIFRSVTVDFRCLSWRLRELALLSPGISFRLRDRRHKAPQEAETFCYPKGPESFIHENANSARTLHDPLNIAGQRNGVVVEIGIQFDESENCRLHSFVNFLPTCFGGTHVEGLLAGIAAAINTQHLGECTDYSPDFIRQGLNCVLSIKLGDPKYYGSTKERLLDPEVFEAVRAVAFEELSNYFHTNPELHSSVLRHLGNISYYSSQMRGDGHRQ